MKGRFAPWLKDLGFDWASDKLAIEACQKPKQLLEVFYKVIPNIEPAFIRNVLLQQSSHIGLHRRRKARGQSRLVDQMVIRNIFLKSGAKFKFGQLAKVKRNKQIVKNMLGHMRRLVEWKEKLMQLHDTEQTRLQILQNDVQTRKQDLALVTQKRAELQRVKATQQPHYTLAKSQIVKAREEIDRRFHDKHAQIVAKLQTERLHVVERNQIESLKTHRLQKLNRIERLKRQIVRNGPQIKRKKMQEESEMEEMIDRDQEMTKHLNVLEDEYHSGSKQLDRCLLDADPRAIQKMKPESQELFRNLDENRNSKSRSEAALRKERQRQVELERQLQRVQKKIGEVKTTSEVLDDSVAQQQTNLHKIQEREYKLREIVKDLRQRVKEKEEVLEEEFRKGQADLYARQQFARQIEKALMEIGQQRTRLMQQLRTAAYHNNPEDQSS